MGESEVLELFRKAAVENDAASMQEGLERLFGLRDGGGLSADDEYQVRHPDYVMEMPSRVSVSVDATPCWRCRKPFLRPQL